MPLDFFYWILELPVTIVIAKLSLFLHILEYYCDIFENHFFLSSYLSTLLNAYVTGRSVNGQNYLGFKLFAANVERTEFQCWVLCSFFFLLTALYPCISIEDLMGVSF